MSRNRRVQPSTPSVQLTPSSSSSFPQLPSQGTPSYASIAASTSYSADHLASLSYTPPPPLKFLHSILAQHLLPWRYKPRPRKLLHPPLSYALIVKFVV